MYKRQIHSHPTKSEIVGEQVFSGNATQPGPKDPTAFANYGTNIIVGPLGQATASTGFNTMTGKTETTINSKPNGVAIYRGTSTTPAVQLTVKAVNKILGR